MSCCHNECTINHIDEFENNKSLYNYIDKDRIECYNCNNNFPISNCIKPYSDRHNNLYLESNCDEQLIIRIPFSNQVKISSMSINGNYNYSPSVVKLYKTHNVLSFDEIDDIKEEQKIEINNDPLYDLTYPLKTMKFNNVNEIVIYIPENYGELVTQINYINFYGEKMKGKFGVVECVYESSALLKDHKIQDIMVGTLGLF